jgi:hypothetical protein
MSTRKPERRSGACKQQKGRAAFDLRAVPAPSHLLEQQKSDKSIAGEPAPLLDPKLKEAFRTSFNKLYRVIHEKSYNHV